MTGKLFLALGLFAVGCSSSLPDRKNNRWADEALWNVLQAQDRRDVAALCNALDHADAEVRRSAALAFASVQDTAGIPCLTRSLDDAEPRVRAAAVFAMGLVADSALVVDLAERAVLESDTSVQRAYLQATFRAMVRNGMLRDPNAILYYLDRNTGHERVRAADALRRLSADTLRNMQATYVDLVRRETNPEVQAMLVRGLRGMAGTEVDELLRQYLQQEEPLLRSAALLAINERTYPGVRDRLPELLKDLPGIGGSAASVWGRFMEPDELERVQEACILHLKDAHVLAGLFQGGFRCDPDPYFFRTWSIGLESEMTNAYDSTLVLTLHRYDEPLVPWIRDFVQLVQEGDHPFLRGQAFEALLAWSGDMEEPRSRALLEELIQEVVRNPDPGLVCILCEAMADATQEWPYSTVSNDQLQGISEQLDLPRDYEAWLLLKQVMDLRLGKGTSPQVKPPFNHPIDRDRLLALENGQRYRIVTDKGEVTLALEVDVAPGSSVAFDSLVTAGYYNGKTFHRQVPGFVVQGGCPRGDGFGSMDWTLRTEVGLPGFSTGAVGLASAGPDTESCQFFIMLGPAPHLDGRYTRFAHVVDGMDVVQRLQVGDVMRRVERLP